MVRTRPRTTCNLVAAGASASRASSRGATMGCRSASTKAILMGVAWTPTSSSGRCTLLGDPDSRSTMSETTELAAPLAGPDPAADPPPVSPPGMATRAGDIARRSGQTWLRPVSLFAGSRLVVVLAAAVAALVDPTRSFVAVTNSWDSGFYIKVAEHGYPTTVPQFSGDKAKLVTAFFPGYALLIKAVHGISGLSWRYSAYTVSIGFAVAASVLLWFFVRELRGAAVA